MSVIGMVLAVRWFLELKKLKKQKKCNSCKECGKMTGKSGFVPMLTAGFTCGNGCAFKENGKGNTGCGEMVPFGFLYGANGYAVFSFSIVYSINTF